MKMWIPWALVIVSMVVMQTITYRRGKKVLVRRILKSICKEWHSDLEERIREMRSELLLGYWGYEFKLGQIRSWIRGAHLTLADVGIGKSVERKIVKRGARIKARLLLENLRNKTEKLRPVDRQQLLRNLLREIRNAGESPCCMSARELKTRYGMTGAEWREHNEWAASFRNH